MLHDFLESVSQELRLPRIVGERCVHALVDNASCSRCVEACPQHAWLLDDEMLGIDTARCDGCGLCAPACPEGALVHEHRLLIRYWNNRRIAVGACERAGLDDTTGVIPCLHSLGLSELLELYWQGCTSLVTSAGDCNDCERKSAVRLDTVLQQVNKMLMSRELPLMQLQSLPPGQWMALINKTLSEARGRGVSRRGFLSQAVKGGALGSARLTGITHADSTAFLPPGERLPASTAGDLMPFVPCIDTARCNGCDACAKLCPHEAISLDIDENTACYRMAARSCTGCRICSDVCEQQAIFIAHNTPAHQTTVNMYTGRCTRCGATFHTPTEGSDNPEVCRICSRVNHHQNLFQVLD